MGMATKTIYARDFQGALTALKDGRKVARCGWNGKGMFIKLISSYSIHNPISDGKILGLRPFIGMKTVDEEFVPWVASQTDLLADDWAVLN